MINVSVVGLGYVGSAMSVVIADAKKNKKNLFNVTGLDLKTPIGVKRIEKLNNFEFPFKSNDKLINIKLRKIRKNNNLMLHAYKIKFMINNIQYNFKAPYNKHFENFLNKNFKSY